MPPKTRSAARKKAGTAPANNDSSRETQQTPSNITPQQPKGNKKASSKKKGGNEEPWEKCHDDYGLGRVVGAKMSNFKHSGLLARDEKALKEFAAEVAEESSPHLARLVSHGGEEGEGQGEELQQVSGRDIYSIQSAHRSTRKPKKKPATEASTTPNTSLQTSKTVTRWSHGVAPDVLVEGVDNRDAGSGVIEQGGTQGSRKRKAPRTHSSSDSERDVETAQPSRKRKPRTTGKTAKRSAAMETVRGKKRVQWTSDSEQDDDVSEEEGEELATVAAQLNRGVTGEQELEDYFTAHAAKAGLTSDHTLSRLARPRLEQEAIQTALQVAPSPFQRDCQQLLEEYISLYSYWLLQMHGGFNILLYGLGSKKRLVEDFSKKCLSQSCHIVINGYFPGLTVKQVLTCFSSDLLGHSGTFKSHSEHAQFIVDTLEKQPSNKGEVFLFIHNLDGPMLRNDSAQDTLSILATSQHLHVIASVDHINSTLLWDQTKMSRFKWAWHDVTTFEGYREETSYEDSLLIRHSGLLAHSSLTHVMKSLTPNARGIFELLAKYQLEHKKGVEKSYQGLAFAECYRRCREKFLVNSDLTLRAQLTEFIDHKLVRSTKGSDGVEYLLILVEDATLAQFLSEFIDQ